MSTDSVVGPNLPTFHPPAAFACAPRAGGVIRHILKNLESVGLLEKHANGGRRLTPSGQRDMDLIAGRVPVVLQQF